MAILNKYKDTLDDLIDSLDTKSLGQSKSSNWPKSIDKETRNAQGSGGASPSL